MSTPTVINEEYDIVIAGGGAAACVVAGRLAAADASLRVLLLEAGPTTYHNPAHTVPLNFRKNFGPDSRTIRQHVSQPSSTLGGRTIAVPCGQCLGGGGSINVMVYSRPSASDYDEWETVYQNPGWGSKDLIPLLRKIETYQVPGGGPTHGADGPLGVSTGGFFSDIAKQFLQAARTLDRGLAHKPDDADANDLETINRNGGRDGSGHPPKPPLLTGVHVKNVTFNEENRATGVTYTLNLLLHPDGPKDTRTVLGTKLVLIAAGAFGSPGILERSGIGAKDVLERVGVKQRVNLPGVGENYQDHNTLVSRYFAADEAQSLDAILRNEEGAIEATAAEFGITKEEILMQNPIDVGFKWRPKPSEVAELGHEFQEYWDSYFANSPDKPVMWFGLVSAFVL
ncbi:GMC oxidoreductase-domain-containing protein [Lactarius quietus]|nr:GMC oxidoreductase-domain-containing protein [Lactarius quietus]